MNVREYYSLCHMEVGHYVNHTIASGLKSSDTIITFSHAVFLVMRILILAVGIVTTAVIIILFSNHLYARLYRFRAILMFQLLTCIH